MFQIEQKMLQKEQKMLAMKIPVYFLQNGLCAIKEPLFGTFFVRKHFLFHLEHFLLMIPRHQEEQQQQSFF